MEPLVSGRNGKTYVLKENSVRVIWCTTNATWTGLGSSPACECPEFRHRVKHFPNCSIETDRLCGLVVRVSGYRYRGPGFDPRRYQIF